MGCSCFGTSHVKRQETSAHRELEGHSLDNIRNFSYKELRLATDDFNKSTKIGRGGFGVVYKGILKDGTQVAVKSLCAESKQGVHEFLTEINTISNVRHLNLVELIGCCVEGSHRILVYEFLENNSLDNALLAPEYVLGGQLTLKADVYSFGVLILETISGRSSSASSWGTMPKAWELYGEGKLLELVDPDLKTYAEEEVIKYIKVAFFCTQATASRRPMMSQVVDMLSRNIRLNEKELTPPGFFQDSNDNKKVSDASTSRQISSFPTTITQLTPR
ncbi:Concanavalin A-like lectin/glucanase, subgroup [Cynara cardunculus var. scolymus]|uniref:Concanavalin A-like lectin/glucanase, subgroup n=1 Tax=Cynara cardunculus var. scolymus TaxID=59895 RepID=A0A103XF68_CYNCS|nr:Concanavalin A-like lectin/glucanase, subgroup [Cynara cardunculus var. scolymus]